MLPGRTRSALYISIHANLVLFEALKQEKVSYLSLAANYSYAYMRLFLLKLYTCVISKNLGKTLLPNVDRSSAAIILFCSKNTTCQRRQIVKLYTQDPKNYTLFSRKSGQPKQTECIPNPTSPPLPFATTPGLSFVIICHQQNAECLTFYDSTVSSISVDAINAITLI